MGHEQAGGSAMFRREDRHRRVGDPRFAVGHVLEREIRGVPAVVMGHHESGRRRDVLQQRVQRDALHAVPSLDHLVTQWMSTVTSSAGRAWSSAHVHVRGWSTRPVISNRQAVELDPGVGSCR